MINKLGKFAVILSLLLVASCDGGKDGDKRGDHGCSIKTNADFHALSLVFLLDHNDPRECPKELNVGESGTAGGTIVETDVQYPYNGKASTVWLNIWDEYTFTNWLGKNSLGDDSEYFSFDTEDRWVVEVWSAFTAGPSPDFGEFYVTLYEAGHGYPKAVNTISYWQEDEGGGGIQCREPSFFSRKRPSLNFSQWPSRKEVFSNLGYSRPHPDD